MSETLATFCRDWTAFMAAQIAIIVCGWLWLRWEERRRNKSRMSAAWRDRQLVKPKAPGSD